MKASVTVGARELKTRLGAYLQRVRGGERIVVTERGTPVAELRSLRDGDDSREARLLRLEAAGLVSRPTRPRVRRWKPVRSGGGALTTAVLEDREDRL